MPTRKDDLNERTFVAYNPQSIFCMDTRLASNARTHTLSYATKVNFTCGGIDFFFFCCSLSPSLTSFLSRLVLSSSSSWCLFFSSSREEEERIEEEASCLYQFILFAFFLSSLVCAVKEHQRASPFLFISIYLYMFVNPYIYIYI